MAFKAHLPHISRKQAAKYVLLPGILPRIRELGGSGFGYLAFLIASVYRAVRILPAGHPYTLHGNIGTFGLRAVVSEAANHVKVSWKTADQVIVFFAILAAIAILFMQFIALIFLLFSGQAFASSLGSPDDYSFFVTAQPAKDVAFLLLDYVFGIPDFFGSEALADGKSSAFHVALQALFKFYNVAILIIAVLIFLYYVIVVVVETAQTGTPFGQRFNTVYAPLRLVIALGMLVPLNYGLNGAQYITLYSAKIGSSFATNGWLRFNDALENPLGADKKNLVAEPTIPQFSNVTEFMAVVHACKAAYKRMENIEIERYLVSDGKVYSLSKGSTSMSYRMAADIFKGNDIKVTFGLLKEEATTASGKKCDPYGVTGPQCKITPDTFSAKGEVMPLCGVLNIPVTTYNPDYDMEKEGAKIGELMGGVLFAQSMFLWDSTKIKPIADELAIAIDVGHRGGKSGFKPDGAKLQEIVNYHNSTFEAAVKSQIEASRDKVDWSLSEDVKQRGWGGAGIWYNKIAQMNGEFLGAVYNLPSAASYPTVLEEILEQKRKTDSGAGACEAFNPNLADGTPVKFRNEQDRYYARVMALMQQSWVCDQPYQNQARTQNAFQDVMHMLFGIQGLFDMRCNNADKTHPLAQLTAIGKGLIDSSVRHMGAAAFTATLGGLAGLLGSYGPEAGAMMQATSGIFVSLATIGLSLGFLLFYILPFMPFLYFFFAVGAWVKGIFEAMVGAPLWALAHIKIDGDGLPGKSAMNGYYLIFEIFLRPILIVVGLIGGMVIFSAAVAILNSIFDVAVNNLTGIKISSSGVCPGAAATADPLTSPEVAEAAARAGALDKNIIGEFFYTIMYAIFVYMIAMSCFKMIDLVPNGIMRFLGAGVTPFADEVQDPTENLGQYAAISGAAIGNKVIGGVRDLGTAGGSLLGSVGDMAGKMGK